MPNPVNLSKLSDVVKNVVAKKDIYDKLVTKVNSIDTSGFVLKTKYDTGKSELENKIANTSGLVKKTDYNTKITKIEGKIPDISNLATKTALNTVENKIPSVSSLVKKTLQKLKISSIITLLKLQKLKTSSIIIILINILLLQKAADVFHARLVRANLVKKKNRF